MKRGIAVTGRGVLTSNAGSVCEFAEALRSARSGIGPLTVIDSSPYYCKKAGQVRDLPEDGRRPHGRVYRMLRAVVDQAVAEADPEWLRQCASTTGIVVGTTSGSASAKEWLLDQERLGPAGGGSREREEECLEQVSFETLPAPIAERFGLGGPMLTTSVSCASGGSAIGLAFTLLSSGDATAMIAAACEAVSRTSFGGFGLVRAMAPETCRPFDRNRQGMLVGEGAAAFVLEPAESAAARGAPIHAEILGFGCCNDAYHSVMPHPKGEGLAASLWQAITTAGLRPNDIDLICAHGTATPQNDAMERTAYRLVFGDRVREVPIMAIKSMIGHTLGAAGAVEIMAAVCALNGGFVPPTLGHQTSEEGCPLWLVRERPLNREMRYAVCCSAAFAGNNTAVVLGRSDRPERRGES